MRRRQEDETQHTAEDDTQQNEHETDDETQHVPVPEKETGPENEPENETETKDVCGWHVCGWACVWVGGHTELATSCFECPVRIGAIESVMSS